MRLLDGQLIAAPTDLANFLACRHKTALDVLVAKGALARPTWKDPLAEVLRQRGIEHERRYVERLQARQLLVVDLGSVDRAERAERTLAAMRDGADVIVQAALENQRWVGYADVLRKVDVPSPGLGLWSYEAHDTKLSRETRSGTILQLCVYSELVAAIQQRAPERFHVVTPINATSYRADDFGAFFRQVTSQFWRFVEDAHPTYPDPVDHCAVCHWSARCRRQRRGDDHLSFVANLGRHHRAELATQGVATLASLAQMPVPITFTPARGAAETYERLREQARLQFVQRESGQPTFEPLPIGQDVGLARLPEPRAGDLFLDLEGDPFGRPTTGAEPGEGSREYLFGLGRAEADGSFSYCARWAFSDGAEHAAFDATLTDIMTALEADPAVHVYHYAPYEPSAFKRLMGRYAAREADVDRLLRGRRFVDLYAVVRHALRAGVETYSIKNLEPLYGFTREVELEEAGDRRRIVELALETGDSQAVTPAVCAAVEGYNKDDCRSLVDLRRWLEAIRERQLATGADLQRPPLEPDEPSEKVSDRQQRVDALRARLLDGVPPEPADRTAGQHARYLLAYLLDWHYREDRAVWWDYFRLLELPEKELSDEPLAVAGLQFAGEGAVIKKRIVGRYSYPEQEIEIRVGDELKLQTKQQWGTVSAHDRESRTIDVLVGPTKRLLRPTSAFVHSHVDPAVVHSALMRLGQATLADPAAGVAAQLLLGLPPAALGRPRFADESTTDFAVRIVHELDADVLAIQGPPGSGKTYTGARMICALLAAGQRIGVTATSHKVIRNLLDAVATLMESNSCLAHRTNDADDDDPSMLAISDNNVARDWLAAAGGRVLGGTAWLWSREEFAGSVDVLFIDEAGQVSLANALAVSQAGRSLVLLGDPQQLEQPQKGSHPDGVGVSTLDHILDGHKTMPAERGLFLPVTWRLAPAICDFTSEVFYEGKLASKAGLEHQRLTGTARFSGAGLFYVPAEHDGCRSASDTEVEFVAGIVTELLAPGSTWVDEHDIEQQITAADILVVAPYNAQVSRLQARLSSVAATTIPTDVGAGFSRPDLLRVGTVDKFQGQEAPVVIYSMATSRPEDAPRGLEFLYSLNRLNVATSRARCAAILVASPRLFEPECRTPRHMQLANALCRFRERCRRQGNKWT